MLGIPLLLLLAPFSVLARPTLSPRLSPTMQKIYEFSGLNLENLAVRSNGHLLVTSSNKPYLYDIDPNASSPTPTMLPQFSNVASVLGIAETSPDVFAVAAGNYSNEQPIPESFSVWSVNMNTPEPTVELITAIPEARGLNGMTALNGFTGTVLVADSVLGSIWKVDVATGDYSVAIQDSNFAPDPSVAAGKSIGINGLRMFSGSVYFTNSASGIFGSLPVTNDGSASGAVDIISRATASTNIYDDFDVCWGITSYIATHANAVTEISGGSQTNMTGGGSMFLQPTSARFGRGSHEGTLYVVNAEDGAIIAVNNLAY